MTRFFSARGERADVNLLRTRDGVEVDFLVHLGNRRAVAIEVKSRAEPLTKKQERLLDSIQPEIEIVEQWVVSRSLPEGLSSRVKAVSLEGIFDALSQLV